MSEISASSGESADTLSLFGAEAELAQLAASGGHDEAATLRLFRRLRGPVEALRGGDGAALRDHLVMVHAPLVEHCARGFGASGEPLDDLVQEGYVGLIKAVDRFDPEKGIKFSTYACHLIAGEIRHYLRDLGCLIHEPGWHFELRQKISRAADALSQTTGKNATPEEIASHLGVKVESVREVLLRSQTLRVDSLEAANEGEENEGRLSILERHEDRKGGERRGDESRIDDKMFLESALPQLKALERQALTLFFFEELSKTEIARRMDLSVNYVSYLVKRGTENLRLLLETPQSATGLALTPSPQAQQSARAAYLLELARGGAQRDARRTFKPRARVKALSRPGVATLTQFAGWIDEEAARTARYGGHFSVLWCQLPNWANATQKLAAADKKATLALAAALVRRQCRAVDKVAAFESADPAGLHFLVLLPSTNARGQSLAHRLISGFVQLQTPPLEGALEAKIAYATFPDAGQSTDELFGALGRELASE